MKKRIIGTAAVVSLLTILAAPYVSAAPLPKDPPAGYATQLPIPDDHGVLLYQDFEMETGDATGRLGKLEATVPEESGRSAPTIEITDEAAYNGTKCLKVSNRGTIKDSQDKDVPNGYNTLNYDNIALDISKLFVKDPNNKNKSENYYFTAYIRNVDPSVTQYFYVQLQYGGTGEVWLPDGDYYKVEGDQWTLIGGQVRNGQVYYGPFMEDTTGAGIYQGRQGMTSWSGLKLVTHDPIEEGKNMTMTNGDFYIDDVVFWRVGDPSTLTPTMPEDNGESSEAPPKVTLAPVGSTEAPADGKTSADTAAPTDPAGSGSAASTPEEADDSGFPVAAAVAIGVGAAVIVAGVAIWLFWISLKKKKSGK